MKKETPHTVMRSLFFIIKTIQTPNPPEIGQIPTYSSPSSPSQTFFPQAGQVSSEGSIDSSK